MNDESSDRKEKFEVKQIKRDQILDHKKKTFVEADDTAYKTYIEEVNKRRESTPLLQTRGAMMSKTDLKVSQSQQNLRTLNKSLSASSINSNSSQVVVG